jgi:uncharacterized membrane protein YebE (DUF533 family)
MAEPDLERAPDGVANPGWIAERAKAESFLPNGRPTQAPEMSAEDQRRRAIELALAAKLLDAHLRNRVQLMQSRPTELTGLSQSEASLLIRAMIAAGHADGNMDREERERLTAVARSGIEPGVLQQSLLAEMDAPPALEQLLRMVETPAMAERFYAVSVAVAGGEQPANRAYLAYLASRLAIGADVVLRINREVSGPRPRIRRSPG